MGLVRQKSDLRLLTNLILSCHLTVGNLKLPVYYHNVHTLTSIYEEEIVQVQNKEYIPSN
jgi:hypothetical protein